MKRAERYEAVHREKSARFAACLMSRGNVGSNAESASVWVADTVPKTGWRELFRQRGVEADEVLPQ